MRLMSSWRNIARRGSRGAPESDQPVVNKPQGPRSTNIQRASAVRDSVDIDESATQFPGHPSETTHLVIGLDLGTSSTKAVIRSPFVGRSRATIVRWHIGNGSPTYLLPTVLYENPHGEFSLTPPEGATRTLHNLKVNLMDEPGRCEARARAAAYLGLTLRTARQWLLDTQKGVYGGFHLRWALNIGIPSAGYDDTKVRDAFGFVARAAWMLSLRPGLPTLDIAIEALRGAGCESDTETPIEVIPEIAAAVVGYARSRYRREGLHVMVDVGASTIDICGFVLHSHDGDDQYELLTASVQRLGVQELHLRRMAEIKAAGAWVRSCIPALLDPFTAIPDAGSKYVDAPSELLCEKLNEIDKAYVNECTNALMRVLGYLRKSRDPRSPHWESGLPVFMAGGGSNFRCVSEAVEQAHKLFTTATTAKGIDPERLPFLGTLTNADISDEMVGRLGVAYGLSFDRPDIGEIHPPHEIEDISPMPRRPRIEALSKDQV